MTVKERRQKAINSGRDWLGYLLVALQEEQENVAQAIAEYDEGTCRGGAIYRACESTKKVAAHQAQLYEALGALRATDADFKQ